LGEKNQGRHLRDLSWGWQPGCLYLFSRIRYVRYYGQMNLPSISTSLKVLLGHLLSPWACILDLETVGLTSLLIVNLDGPLVGESLLEGTVDVVGSVPTGGVKGRSSLFLSTQGKFLLSKTSEVGLKRFG
jgi:hypothetical protein